MRMRENERQPRRRVYAKPVKRRAPRRFEALGARRSGTMWGMETLKKLKQKAGSRNRAVRRRGACARRRVLDRPGREPGLGASGAREVRELL